MLSPDRKHLIPPDLKIKNSDHIMPTLYNLIPLSAAFRIVPYIALQPLPPYNSPVLSSHRHPKEPADLHAPKPIG